MRRNGRRRRGHSLPTEPPIPGRHLQVPGRVLAAEEYDWPEVVHNLWRARQKLAGLTQVLIRERVDARKLGHIYLAVVDKSCYTSQRHRSWTRVCRGCWADSTIGWPIDRQGSNRGRNITEAGFTPLWRILWRRWGYRRWRPTSLVVRTPWRNILRLGPVWTCTWLRSGGQGQEWRCGGGNRRVWIWRGCRQLTRRRSGRSRRRKQKGRRLRWKISKVRRIL